MNLSTADVVAGSIKRRGLQWCAPYLYWLEQRPHEAGRGVIVRYDPVSDLRSDITPSNYSVRSKVHEYGGGDFLATCDGIFFVNNVDQCVYSQAADGVRTLTRQYSIDTRYADFSYCEQRKLLCCVRERHCDTVINDLIAISQNGEITILANGADFYSAPRVSADGKKLCWLQWNLPSMPWDNCQLYQARLTEQLTLTDKRTIVKDDDIAVLAPSYDVRGTLWFADDRDGFWRVRNTDDLSKAYSGENRDCGIAAWSLGQQPYCVNKEQTIASIEFDSGAQRLCIDGLTVNAAFAECGAQLVCAGAQLFFFATQTAQNEAMYRFDLNTLALQCCDPPTANDAIVAETIWVNGVHAYYYQAATSEPSPLIVFCHSGPTGLATAALNLTYQFYLQHGFSILDINYRGSYGFGREYRQALLSHWGVLDVADCAAVLATTMQTKAINRQRIYLRGNSAGGLTALHWLAQHSQPFRAAALRYPVVDLASLQRCSHKFEVGYLGELIGARDERDLLWSSRSPLSAIERIDCPLLVSQGSADPVVPVKQAETLQTALYNRGIPCRLDLLVGEGHGFRRQESLNASLEAELAWFQH